MVANILLRHVLKKISEKTLNFGQDFYTLLLIVKYFGVELLKIFFNGSTYRKILGRYTPTYFFEE
jgi:hypothetical protein